MLVRGDTVLAPVNAAVPTYFKRLDEKDDNISIKCIEQYVVTETPAIQHLQLAIRLAANPVPQRINKGVKLIRKWICVFHWIALVLITIALAVQFSVVC